MLPKMGFLTHRRTTSIPRPTLFNFLVEVVKENAFLLCTCGFISLRAWMLGDKQFFRVLILHSIMHLMLAHADLRQNQTWKQIRDEHYLSNSTTKSVTVSSDEEDQTLNTINKGNITSFALKNIATACFHTGCTARCHHDLVHFPRW